MQTRIITGTLKGRVLQLPPAEAARPTRNRILQAAFNVLQSYTDWEGMRVLDACCGSGAWGLEAYSRGASDVVLLDTNPKTAKANVQALGIKEGIEVMGADAARYAPSAPFDVVLADPPYADTQLIEAILANAPKWGNQGSIWAIETAASYPLTWPAGFTEHERRTYGTSALHVAVWEGENHVA
jgi:16S rRNA (guanine(966)-N(2))-methyltransferase RsmD